MKNNNDWRELAKEAHKLSLKLWEKPRKQYKEGEWEAIRDKASSLYSEAKGIFNKKYGYTPYNGWHLYTPIPLGEGAPIFFYAFKGDGVFTSKVEKDRAHLLSDANENDEDVKALVAFSKEIETECYEELKSRLIGRCICDPYPYNIKYIIKDIQPSTEKYNLQVVTLQDIEDIGTDKYKKECMLFDTLTSILYGSSLWKLIND